MSTLPYIEHDSNALLNVDRAHKALDKVQDEIRAAIEKATADINTKFNPVTFTAQSVLYEAMGKAAEAGFTYQQLCDTMDCDSH